MKNPTNSDFRLAVSLRLKGKGWSEVLRDTGLSHSQAELAEFRFKRDLADLGVADLADWKSVPVPEGSDAGEIVKALRAEGISWGVIACRMHLSESKARRAFTATTSTKSQGLRIGKGGRFLDSKENGHRYYENGDNRKSGLFIPKEFDQRQAELTEDGKIKGLKPEQREILMAAGAAKYAARKALKS